MHGWITFRCYIRVIRFHIRTAAFKDLPHLLSLFSIPTTTTTTATTTASATATTNPAQPSSASSHFFVSRPVAVVLVLPVVVVVLLPTVLAAAVVVVILVPPPPSTSSTPHIPSCQPCRQKAARLIYTMSLKSSPAPLSRTSRRLIGNLPWFVSSSSSTSFSPLSLPRASILASGTLEFDWHFWLGGCLVTQLRDHHAFLPLP